MRTLLYKPSLPLQLIPQTPAPPWKLTAPWERRKRALSAPAFSSKSTHSVWPLPAAQWSGVSPRLWGEGFEGGGRLGGPPFCRELESGKDPGEDPETAPEEARNCSAVHFLLGFLCLDAACATAATATSLQSQPLAYSIKLSVQVEALGCAEGFQDSGSRGILKFGCSSRLRLRALRLEA